jgi:hypothetical protein
MVVTVLQEQGVASHHVSIAIIELSAVVRLRRDTKDLFHAVGLGHDQHFAEAAEM